VTAFVPFFSESVDMDCFWVSFYFTLPLARYKIGYLLTSLKGGAAAIPKSFLHDENNNALKICAHKALLKEYIKM